jgi:hypothetical protein
LGLRHRRDLEVGGRVRHLKDLKTVRVLERRVHWQTVFHVDVLGAALLGFDVVLGS